MANSPLGENAEISQHESCTDLSVKILWFQNSSYCFEATHGLKYFYIYLSCTTLGHMDLQYSDMQVIYVSFTITTFTTC